MGINWHGLLFLLLASPSLACPTLSGKWTSVLIPTLGNHLWNHDGAHVISLGDTAVHIVGNQTVLALDGSQDCDEITSQVSFTDVPGTKSWLDERLDRTGVCAQFETAYPDTIAAGVCFGLDREGNGACLLEGSELPFGQVPPRQSGGLYSVLYIAQSKANGGWKLVGTPVIFPNGPIKMGIMGKMRATLTVEGAHTYLTGSSIFPGAMAAIRQPIASVHGLDGFQVVHNPNMLCSPNRGEQQVNVKEFTTQ